MKDDAGSVRLLMSLGLAMEITGMAREAVQSYESMLPYISSAQSTVGTSAEHRLWSERLLARHSMLVGRHITAYPRASGFSLDAGSPVELADILKPYRAWAEFWDDKHSRAIEQQSSLSTENSSLRTRIWKSYYDTVSVLVQQQIVKPVFESRLKQANELKRVEAICEQIILKDAKFPKADQATPEIEGWVDQVMTNWRVLLDPPWKEEDLSSGGRAALGRNVLDVSLSFTLWPRDALHKIRDRSLQACTRFSTGLLQKVSIQLVS